MARQKKYIEFENRDLWRQWLKKNHGIESRAWLVIYKKKYQDQGLALDEAVEEALCFGWIDGHLRRLDEKCYLLRFSPRRSGSIWSITNIQRVKKLIERGKMTDAGFQKISGAKENGEWDAAIRREQVDIIPGDLENQLRKIDGAMLAYQALSTTRKKQIIYTLQSAKQEDTKKRRIQKIIEELLDQ